MKILAITSGKGGVGKTTLSVNIARQMSLAGLRTILIDLDIHNKGATSLFLDKVETSAEANSGLSVMGMLSAKRSDSDSPHTFQLLICPLDPEGKLLFWPATQAQELVDWNALHSENSKLRASLSAALRVIQDERACDVAVLDCYGGIDSLTIAAAGIANDTIVVNEADLITFSGTLLLYAYLSEVYDGSPTSPRIHFVINRITSRHSFEFLQREYRKSLFPLASDHRVLAYLPFDRLIMDTFGDYPFYTELLPDSLMTRKIRLAICEMWPDIEMQGISTASLRAKRGLFKRTSESQFAEPEAILRTLVSIPLWIVVPALLLLTLPSISAGRMMSYGVVWQLTHIPAVLLTVLLIALGVFEPFQISRWLMRVAKYSRRKRALRKKYNFPSRIILSTVGLLYALLPAFTGLFFAGVLISKGGHLIPLGWRDITQWHGGVYGVKPGADLRGLAMAPNSSFQEGIDLSSVRLGNASLKGVSFRGVKLSGADLSEADASSADFSRADLERAKFEAANLTDATFDSANLSNADLSHAILPGLEKFRGVAWTGAKLSGSTAGVELCVFAQKNGAYIDSDQEKAAGAWLKLNLHDSADLTFDKILELKRSQMLAVTPEGSIRQLEQRRAQFLENSRYLK